MKNKIILLLINNIMISNKCKKYNLRPNNRNKYCKNNYIYNEDIKESQEKYELFHDEKECFICLEVYIDNSKTIRLNNMNNYIKTCSCNGWIHEQCFNSWHIVNKHCPICRTVIIFTKYEYYILIIHNFKQNICDTIFILLILIKQTLLYSLFLWFLYNLSIYFFKKTPMLLN
jgi:hypothetical protein